MKVIKEALHCFFVEKIKYSKESMGKLVLDRSEIAVHGPAKEVSEAWSAEKLHSFD